LEQALALNQQSAISGRENSRHARKRGYAEREKEKLMDIIRNSRNQEWEKGIIRGTSLAKKKRVE